MNPYHYYYITEWAEAVDQINSSGGLFSGINQVENKPLPRDLNFSVQFN